MGSGSMGLSDTIHIALERLRRPDFGLYASRLRRIMPFQSKMQMQSLRLWVRVFNEATDCILSSVIRAVNLASYITVFLEFMVFETSHSRTRTSAPYITF